MAAPSLLPGFDRRTVEVEGRTAITAAVGGSGPPVLLLHGYPQSHVMWHRVAPVLAEDFTVVAADLRGYGDSGRPPAGPDHAGYSKRAMAADQLGLMAALGLPSFAVVGHDRGARVAHRMCLDAPDRVTAAAVLDVVPTRHVFAHVDRALAETYFHWFFLTQPAHLPERMIGADPGEWIRGRLRRWSAEPDAFDEAAVAEYVRCGSDPASVHAQCEDYRAAASIDLEHDAADAGRLVTAPLLALWGGRGFVGRTYDVLGIWREYAADVRGEAVDCGHFLPEEAPGATTALLREFLLPRADPVESA